MKNAQILSLLFAAAVCMGCDNKVDNPQPDVKVDNPQPDVYVVGKEIDAQGTTFAIVWKNGVVQNLGEGEAYSVFVQNNDVYVAGWGLNALGFRVAMLWENGIGKELTEGWGEAKSVFVSGTDVYVALNERNKSKIWKNGRAEMLPNGGRATCVFVSGNDVYVAGNVSVLLREKKGSIINVVEIRVATVWKNGEVYQAFTEVVDEIDLNSDRITYAEASSVFVSGNDVYVLERTYHPFPIHDIRVWKNGVILYLLDNESNWMDAISLFVSGNDAYVCGSEENIPIFWKNGNKQTLPSGTNYGVANSIFVSGNDVYVVGTERETYSPVSQSWDAKLWTNGIGKVLANGETRIIPYSVFVVKK